MTRWLTKIRCLGNFRSYGARTIKKLGRNASPSRKPPSDVGPGAQQGLRAAGVPCTFTKWRDLAAYLDQWRVLCGAKARGTVHTPPKQPRDIWAQVADGPPPSNTAHPTTAPTRPRRQQLRTPAPTPELKATQKWRAAFMGDHAFARARAAGTFGEERNRGRPRPRQSRGRHRPQPSSRIQGLEKRHESGIYHALSPAGSRTLVEQQTQMYPRHPRLVIAMRCLIYEIWGVTT